MIGKAQQLEIARRLENWARWYYGGAGGAGASPFPAYRLHLGGAVGKSGGGVPVLAGEAEDTDAVLRSMNPRLVVCLKVHYLQRGTPGAKAKRCKCPVRTFYHRVRQAELVFWRLVYPSPRSRAEALAAEAADFM